MIKTKRTAVLTLLILSVITFLAGTQLTKLSFNYDFESLFATDDPNLAFYKAHRTLYGDDNDYLLLAFQPESGVFNEGFLERLQRIEKQISQSQYVDYTLSPLSLRYFVRSPMGITQVPYLKISNRATLQRDSVALISDEEIVSQFFSKELDALLILIRHKSIDDQDAAVLLKSIEEHVQQAEISNYYLAGKTKAQQEFVSSIKSDFGLFLIVGALLMTTAIWLLYRRWIIILASLMIITIVMVLTFSLMAITEVSIDVLSALIPLILIIVSISDIVHFSTRFQREIRKHPVEEAITQTWKQVGLATFLTSITTAIGFFTLVTASSASITGMGLFTGVGVLLAFVVTILVLPSVLVIHQAQHRKSSIKDNRSEILDKIFHFLVTHRKAFLATFLGLTVIATLGLTRIQINATLIGDLPNDGSTKKSFVFFDEEMGGSKPWELSLQVSDTTKAIYDWEVLVEIEKIELYLQEEYGIKNLTSPLTMVRMYEKAITGKYELPTGSVYQGWGNRWRIARSKQMFDKITTKDEMNGRITGFVQDLGSAQTQEMNTALAQFISQNINQDLIKARLTGTTYLIDRSHHLIVTGLFKGLLLAIFIVAIIIAVFFRDLKLMLIAIVANIIPVLLIAGLMGWIGIDLSLSNGIIFVISFGIAVDDTMHFLSKFSIEKKVSDDCQVAIKNTFVSTGKAIVFTTLILTAGFALFSLSSFNTTFYIGILVSTTLIFALLTDMILLPLLLSITYKSSNNS